MQVRVPPLVRRARRADVPRGGVAQRQNREPARFFRAGRTEAAAGAPPPRRDSCRRTRLGSLGARTRTMTTCLNPNARASRVRASRGTRGWRSKTPTTRPALVLRRPRRPRSTFRARHPRGPASPPRLRRASAPRRSASSPPFTSRRPSPRAAPATPPARGPGTRARRRRRRPSGSLRAARPREESVRGRRVRAARDGPVPGQGVVHVPVQARLGEERQLVRRAPEVIQERRRATAAPHLMRARRPLLARGPPAEAARGRAARAEDFPDASPASRWCGENRVPAGDREPGDLRSGNPSDPPALPIGEGISSEDIAAPRRSDRRCCVSPPPRTLDDRRSAPAKSSVGMNSPEGSRFKPHLEVPERSMPLAEDGIPAVARVRSNTTSRSGHSPPPRLRAAPRKRVARARR